MNEKPRRTKSPRRPEALGLWSLPLLWVLGFGLGWLARGDLALEAGVVLALGVFLLLLGLHLRGAAQGSDPHEEGLDQLYGLTEDFLCLVGDDGYFKRVNPAFTRTLGYTEEELLSRPVGSFVHPEDRQATVVRLERLAQGEPVVDIENRYRTRDGSYRWLAWRSITSPEGGTVFGIARDITEKKQSEEDLRRSQERLAEAQRLAHLGSWEVPLDSPGAMGKMSWSAETYRIFGVSPQRFEPTLESFWQAAPEEERGPLRARILEAISEGQNLDLKLPVQRPGGDLRTVHLRAEILDDVTGDHRRLMGSALDITRHVRAQQALAEASRAKSIFLANMSHEIRTPLNGILGLARLLFKSDLGPTDRDHVEIIRNSGEMLLDIINDVLDFSKIEAGKLVVEKVDFSLETLLSQLLEMMAPRAEGRGVELRLRRAEGTPDTLRGDPTRLRQVLLNLLSNALKFTPEGFVELRVEPSLAEEEGSIRLAFAVHDTGIGIPAEAMETLFDPFIQADTSTNRQFGGTGLGLAISQRIVGFLGGEITVESQPGHGSIFRFTALFEPAHGEIQDHSVARVHTASWSGTSPRLLVVEDEPINRRVIVRLLEDLELEVTAVHNGEEALGILAREDFDLVLMDCQMPELDGYEATRRLRRTEQEGDREPLPVVAMTAHALSGDREKCLAAGMDDYLSKPFREEELIRLLEDWLGYSGPATKSKADEEELKDVDLGGLEPQALEALAGIGGPERDVLGAALEMFLEQTPKKLKKMEEVLDSEDLTTFARMAHSLVGNAGIVGARDFAQACRNLQKTALGAEMPKIRGEFQEVEGALHRVDQDIRRVLEQRASALEQRASAL